MIRQIMVVVALAAAAALVWRAIPWSAPAPPPTVLPASDLAPITSPRPRQRLCAGTVTGNPAIDAWRAEIGCDR